MKILIDMNLSPSWCAVFRAEGWEAIHWSEVGDYTASDAR
jgi:predicted nuclease of predicted toxin-antitoxin system